jgi:hypothetical protein
MALNCPLNLGSICPPVGGRPGRLEGLGTFPPEQSPDLPGADPLTVSNYYEITIV